MTDEQVRNQIWNQVADRTPLWTRVSNLDGNQVGVRDRVWNRVVDQVGGQLGRQVWHQAKEDSRDG